MIPDPETSQIISGCMLRLRERNAFFASLALFARLEVSEKISTAATDGRTIFINPNFFNPLPVEHRDSVLLHEVLHAALLHATRRGGRDPRLWNIAADIVVNGIIRQQGYSLPKGAVMDPRWERFSVDEIYERLLKNAKHHAGQNPDDLLDEAPQDAEEEGGAFGNPISAQAANEDPETYWAKARQQAEIIAESKEMGNRAGALRRELEEVGDGTLNWKNHLWRYLVQTPVDYTSFDRRFVWQRTYLETLDGKKVQIAIAVDTSGSINHDYLRMFLAEVRDILASYPHLVCDLYYVDAKIHGPYRLRPREPLPEPVGGGGTDFRPFFQAVENTRDGFTPLLAVYMTDGYGRFPTIQPSFDTLWVVTPYGKELNAFPFGERTRLRFSAETA